MVGFAIFDNNPFDVRSTKSTNTGRQAFTAKQAFIDPDAGKIIEATVLKSYPLNDPKERFFSAQKNSFNFPESTPSSKTAADKIYQFYAASDRSLANGSNKYGSSSLSSLNRGLGRELANA